MQLIAFLFARQPLKPFSGRVVDVVSLTLAKLDHGFHYDDDTIPVVVAPIQTIGNEWRFVMRIARSSQAQPMI